MIHYQLPALRYATLFKLFALIDIFSELTLWIIGNYGL